MRGRGVIVRQNDSSDCGAAALQSVAAHFGLRVSLSWLRHLSGTDSNGTTLKGLKEAANKIGLKAEGYRGEAHSLEKIPKPAILHLKQKEGGLHFVVLYGLYKRGFRVMDPKEGAMVRVSRERLLEEWSGVLMLFSPQEELQKAIDKGEIAEMGRVLELAPHLKESTRAVTKRWRLFPTTLFLSLITTAGSFATALFIKELLDSVIPLGNYNRVVELSIIMIIIIVLSVGVTFLRSSLLLKESVKVDKELTNNYLDQLYHIPLPTFSSFKTGELVSRIADIYRVRNLVAATLPEMIVALVTLALSIVLLFKINGQLAPIALLFIPLYLSLFLIHDKVNRGLMRRVMERASHFQSGVIESLRSMATIKNFGLEERAYKKGEVGLIKLNKTIERTGRAALIAGSVATLLSGVLSIMVLWLGGVAVISGRVTIGEMLSFYTIIALFSAPLGELASSFASIREGVIASSRLYDLLSIKREELLGKKPVNKEVRERKVRLIAKGLSFGYPGRATLFEELTFTLERGKITLLKGESGSGKSSLISLLMRHNSPLSGEIVLEGMGSPITLAEWREQIAIVPQNPDLYGETILESILLGREVEEHYFEEVIKALELESFAKRFPYSLLSNPGENGSLLSRGEQQRVAFARAALKRAPIMLLDEATSSLDVESERIITNFILKLKGEGCAILMVSHNLQFSKIADEIIEL